MPALDVARHPGVGQRRAPARLVAGVEVGRIDLRHRPAIDPQAAVVFLQPVAKRAGRHRLQVGIDGGADGQPAGEEFVVAELLGQLAADLVGEVVARRHLAARRGDVAALHRQQILGLGGVGVGPGHVAVQRHLVEHVVAPGDRALLLAHRVQHARRLRQRREIRGLGQRELLQRLGEVGLRRRRDAVGVLAQEDLVEIELQDRALRQRVLQPGGEDDLLDLALARAVAGQQEVLHHLLGDRRGAAQPPAVHRRVVERRHDAARVEAVVLVEVLVLGRDEGILHPVGDLVDRREDPSLAGELVHEPALSGIDPAERRRLVVLELGVVGQVLAVDGEDRRQTRESHDRTDRQPAENKTEKPEDQSKHDSGSITARGTVSEATGNVKNRAPGRRRGAHRSRAGALAGRPGDRWPRGRLARPEREKPFVIQGCPCIRCWAGTVAPASAPYSYSSHARGIARPLQSSWMSPANCGRRSRHVRNPPGRRPGLNGPGATASPAGDQPR